ncbi:MULTISPECIES: hypothetical protein [Shewanella]|uniref:hypothetical protein n=1 Tax=Shewanella TaxID=22 RepID=UPI0006E50351|nr:MULTISPECIES: hypothetical protein [Shewanella]KPZ69776.1 hypothetical protein AN944_02757 [Shewanella sp. P1-14-1]MBQ4889682.1 hypothetical protein [Shewanella sp. MMG014]
MISHIDRRDEKGMQIGCCWFDDERKVLINQSTATKWQLNHSEYWVLSILAKHRGQVVPIETLAFLEEEQGCHQKLSVDEMEQLVENFKDYFGDSHRGLIELIADQGVILYNRVVGHHSSLLDTPNKAISNAHYILIILMTLLACNFVYSNLSAPEFVIPDVSRTFESQSGASVVFKLYGDDKSERDFSEVADTSIAALKQCDTILWDSISATLAKGDNSVSILLKKQVDKGVRFHNIKVLRDNPELLFVSTAWLKKVRICGE